jgi:putative flippase GtrA
MPRQPEQHPNVERYDPDLWTDEFAFLNQPGHADIRTAAEASGSPDPVSFARVPIPAWSWSGRLSELSLAAVTVLSCVVVICLLPPAGSRSFPHRRHQGRGDNLHLRSQYHHRGRAVRTPPDTLNSRDCLMLASRKSSVRIKAVSFGLVGAVNTLLDLGVFWIALVRIGLPPLLANLLAWVVAVSSSYLMNCFTTFAAESERKVTLRTYASFVASGAAGFMMSSAALIIVALFMNILAAKLVAIAVSFAVNFSLSHFLIFRPLPAIKRRKELTKSV